MSGILRWVFGSMDSCEACGIRPTPSFHQCRGGYLLGEFRLREERRFAEIFLLREYRQINHRIPSETDTWIGEDYYGAGIRHGIDPGGQAHRIVVRNEERHA